MIPAYELALQRSHPQSSDIYLIVQQPQRYTDAEYVAWQEWVDFDYSCQVDGNPLGDPIATITVDNGSAAVTLLDGMTVLIGSTLGDWDKAVVRLRGDQDVDGVTTTLDIATSSDIRGVVKDGDWIVVLDEFRLWQRFGRIEVDGGNVTWWKDYDILWDDLGGDDDARRLASLPPVPIMGPHAVKFIDTPGVTSQFWFDWQDSYAVAPEQAVTAWDSWGEQDFAGNEWTDNTVTPGWQDFLGISGLRGYRVRLEVDDGNGNDVTLPFRRGIRYVFTLRRPGQSQPGDPANAEPITSFKLNSPVSGSFAQGYWRVSITVYEDAASKYTIMPGALVILFTDDWYVADDPYLAPRGLRNTSVGPIFDRENILFVGRVAAGSIRIDPETQDLTFDAVSPGEEAAVYENYPIVIEYDDGADDWIETPGLTVDMAVRHYVAWHTTMSLIADVYQTGDTHTILAQDFLQGAIYSTLNTFLWDRLFARLLGDRFGRFFCEIDVQMQTYGSVDTLWILEDTDWLDALAARHYETDRCKAAECGGIIYTGGDDIVPKLSRAPGTFDKYRGALKSSNALAITDQDEVNVISGRLLQYRNLEWEVDIKLAGHWKYCDIAPQSSINVDGGAAISTERGDITGRLIIRDVNMEYLESGCVFTSIRTESEETDGTPGITIVIPDELPDIPPPERPDPPGWIPPGGGFVYEDSGRRMISCNKGVFVTDELGLTNPVWYALNDGVPANELRCWKIIRDPWHWWTSGGTERTLWGLFTIAVHGCADTQPFYIYKMENFPDGTWQLQAQADTLTGGGNRSAIYDIVGSIEIEDMLFIIASDQAHGFCSAPVRLYATPDGGASWVYGGAETGSTTFAINWPNRASKLAVAQHSAGLFMLVTTRVFAGTSEDVLARTFNRGASWDNPGNLEAIGLAHGAVRGLSIPYLNAAWDDSESYIHYGLIGKTTNLKDPTATWQSIGLAGADCRALSVCQANHNIIAGAFDAGTDGIWITYNAGVDWELWQACACERAITALFNWEETTLVDVLVQDYWGSRILLVTATGVTDKTGNLEVVTGGMDYITKIDRDTMGSA